MCRKLTLLLLFYALAQNVQCASFFDNPYEYVMGFGKNIAPSIMSIWDCVGQQDAWGCAKERIGSILDGWDRAINVQRSLWQAAADAEIVTSGRSIGEMPSQLGAEVEDTLNSLTEFLSYRISRALEKRKHESAEVDSITISTGEKKKIKKKKPKPPKIHLLHPIMLKAQKKQEKGRESRVQSWVIGERSFDEEDSTVTNDSTVRDSTETISGMRRGRGVMTDLWSYGQEALDAVAEHAVESENLDNGVADKSSLSEQRGKKKKKKKAILKLLILGAVLKAKIGTLLQILSFKLQVKFFIIALLGLAVNLARLWIDIKNKHNQQPQKVIYYEHAQHQHHYDHEDEHEHGWGPWSRSMEPEETDVSVDVDVKNSPYRAYARNVQLNPIITKL
ncbi:hypothetical protein O3G_MSEX003372 [Manduca sexta]|uniref:Uncharacterized protein n=1 Tax=Manduca sexta TaxID=7130 RepID=A0A921YS78_MANSE|nr:hypothetical protein O3G_MSEX003372 [Manduca sexta]